MDLVLIGASHGRAIGLLFNAAGERLRWKLNTSGSGCGGSSFETNGLADGINCHEPRPCAQECVRAGERPGLIRSCGNKYGGRAGRE